jgi:hypothetical protein
MTTPAQPTELLKLIVPYRFVTILIIAHGEDLPRVLFENVFNVQPVSKVRRAFTKVKEAITSVAQPSNHYKLTLSGLTGNVTQGSSTLDRLYFDIPRILAHNRTMSPLEKLHTVCEKVHEDFDFEYEEFIQEKGHEEHIDDRPNEYQRIPRKKNANWFPLPTNIMADRQYYFTANPINSNKRRHSVSERNEFGVWLVDASLDIANSIDPKLTPGSGSSNVPISLLSMLKISLSTARTPNSNDTSNATITTLFTIMAQLMRFFGKDIHINVIDITCRYLNWDKYFPGSRKRHKIGSHFQKFGERVPFGLGKPLERFGDILAQEVASPTAFKGEYESESISGGGVVEEWYHDGNIRIQNNVYSLTNQPDGVYLELTKINPDRYHHISIQIKGHQPYELDTTTFFQNMTSDFIINGNGIQTTHDIEVFYVQMNPFLIIVTLTRKPNALGIQSRYQGENNRVITAYLNFVGINSNTRLWTMDESPLSAITTPYAPSVRTEALPKKRRLSSPSRHSSPTRIGGKNKRKKYLTQKKKKMVKFKKTFRKRFLKTKIIK